MGEAVELIELNLKKVSNMKDLFKEVDESNKELKQKLTFKGFERKVNLLNYSITVCADPNCKKYEYIGETRKRVPTYPQICDEPCKLKGVTFEATNRHQLYRCKVMRDGKCSKCNHDYRVHMHLNYTTTLVEKEFLPKDAQDKITEMDNHKAQREAFIAELEKRIMELEDEKKYIFECASQYGVFLKQNALIIHNDSFSDYLDMLIKEEEAKETMIRDDKRIAELKENKQAYEQQKEQIMRKVQGSSDSNKEVIYLEKIYEIKAKLCSLKHSGETLKETLGIVNNFNMLYFWQAMLIWWNVFRKMFLYELFQYKVFGIRDWMKRRRTTIKCWNLSNKPK